VFHRQPPASNNGLSAEDLWVNGNSFEQLTFVHKAAPPNQSWVLQQDYRIRCDGTSMILLAPVKFKPGWPTQKGLDSLRAGYAPNSP
jgi:hypothetical protein